MKKHYALEFKAKVAQEALKTHNASSIARQYSLNSILVLRWVREFKRGEFNRPYG